MTLSIHAIQRDMNQAQISQSLDRAASAANPRFPLFDALRAVAVMAVFAYHLNRVAPTHSTATDLLSHGNCGVAIFFVISGFLLYRPYVAARYGARPVAATAFYWRRVLRILPAYWLALTALAVYPGLARFSDRWWQLYSLTQVYDPRTTFAGIGPAWSLCIEASFYLLLPLYALAASRLYCARRGPRREAAVLASLALGSIAFHVLIGRTGENSLLAYTLPGTFYLFALGMALALISVVGNRVERVVRERGALCWLAAGGTYLVVATSTDAESLGSVHPVYGVVATLLVLPAVFPSEKLAGRTLAIPGLAWLGVISYGVYLWHQEMLIEIHRLIPAPLPLAAVALGGTVAIAATSYYLLELPFLRLKRRSPWSRPAMHDRDGWAGSPYAGPPVPHGYGPPENEHGLA